MADDTEPRNDAGEEPENYDYDENNNSDDNPAQPSSDNTTPVAHSHQQPSNGDNFVDEDQAAADAAAVDAAAAANSDGHGFQDNYDAEYDDDEPLPDVTVNLYINELGDAAVTDSVNDYLTDQYGNRIGFDTTTIVQDLIDRNDTATGKHGWLGEFIKEKYHWEKSFPGVDTSVLVSQEKIIS